MTVSLTQLNGYEGPIDIEVKGLPPGVTASAATILPGQTSTIVALSAVRTHPRIRRLFRFRSSVTPDSMAARWYG